MPNISQYERLQIESLLNRRPQPVEPGVGLALIPDDEFSRKIFQAAVKPAMQTNELSVVLFERVFDSDSPLCDICHWLARAELIVADVTGLNPHILYVLGLAHAMARCPILLAAKPADLPFNLQALRCIEFSRHTSGLFDLREQLTRSIRIFLTAARATPGL